MQGAVALVTGGSGDIGRAIVLELAQAGADVAIHYHRGSAKAARLASEIRGLGRKAVRVEADLGAPRLPETFVTTIEQKLGPITHLVYNAGVSNQDMAAFMSLEDWDQVMAVNLRGAVMVCQAALASMLRSRKGSIVLVGSEAAQGSPGLAAYAASKAGLVGFARSLAAEVGKRGVRVNVVSPGLVVTEMLEGLPEDKRKAIAERSALGRLGMPGEVAKAVRFLLSDDASYITGTVLSVNGGLGVF